MLFQEPLVPQCRLIVETERQSGAVNMAIDEVLLESAASTGLATVRWYGWSQPTLSLGYFQRSAEVTNDPRWQTLSVVRRLTGGGAILHDWEWTYSVALPPHLPTLRHPYDLYDRVHEVIVETLSRVTGIALRPRGTSVGLGHTSEPFLCYRRQDSHDLCLQTTKLVGSAQRRRRGALLQHGSLILRHSAAAPEIAGLWDLVPSVQPPGQADAAASHGLGLFWPDVGQQVAGAIAQAIGAVVREDRLAAAEWTNAHTSIARHDEFVSSR